MKLNFNEADVLAWFLKDYEAQFIKCADEFGYEKAEAEEMHESIRMKIVGAMFRDVDRKVKKARRHLTTPLKSQHAQHAGELH